MKNVTVEQLIPYQRELSRRLSELWTSRIGGAFPVMLYFPTVYTWDVGHPDLATLHCYVDLVEVIPARPGRFDSAAAARRLLFAAYE